MNGYGVYRSLQHAPLLGLLFAAALLIAGCSQEQPAPPVPRLVKTFTAATRQDVYGGGCADERRY